MTLTPIKFEHDKVVADLKALARAHPSKIPGCTYWQTESIEDDDLDPSDWVAQAIDEPCCIVGHLFKQAGWTQPEFEEAFADVLSGANTSRLTELIERVPALFEWDDYRTIRLLQEVQSLQDTDFPWAAAVSEALTNEAIREGTAEPGTTAGSIKEVSIYDAEHPEPEDAEPWWPVD